MSGGPLPAGSHQPEPAPAPKTYTQSEDPDYPIVADDGKGPWCAHCGGTLKGSQIMEIGDKEFHPRCFACFACKKPLTGQMLTVADKYFHPGCLTCKHCGSKLENKSFVVNPTNHQAYCPEHARLTSQTAGAGVLKCGGCLAAISGKESVINALGEKWHQHCFVCENCKETLVGKQTVVQNKKPYCEKCFETLFRTKCVGCDKVIDGQVMEIDSDGVSLSYHPTCFRCSTCNKSLKGIPFYVRDNAVYCETHAM